MRLKISLIGLFLITLLVNNEIKGDWGPAVNLGPPANTPYFEIAPAVDPGDTLLFFFYRPAVLDSIGMSKKIGGAWQKPKFLGPPFNPNAAEVPTSVLAIPGGIRLYFSSKRGGGLGGADIWYSDLVNGQWSDPVNLGAPVNSPTNDNCFRILTGGQRAYFISQRTGSRGDHDIWFTEWVSGQWTTPVNLGDSINSVYSDQSPTMTDDEQEMYFWRGGPGMVETQIFTARKANGVWQGAVRVGPPIHPVSNWYDDEPYLLPPGNRLYYSGPEDTIPPYTNWDIWYVDRVVGVEEQEKGQGNKGARGQGLQLKVKNPAHQPLTISYTLPDAVEARFDLYNGLGRWIKTINEGQRAAGRHEVNLATNFAAGIYFVRLVTPKETLTQRITILR
jgi:hypothetical protein